MINLKARNRCTKKKTILNKWKLVVSIDHAQGEDVNGLRPKQNKGNQRTRKNLQIAKYTKD